MKKSDIFLIIGLIIVIVAGCFLMKGEKYEPNYKLPLTLSGEPGLQELTYAEYKEKIDNEEHFVIIIERATCGHCVSYMPVAEDYAKDKQVPLYYVDTDKFSEDDWSGFEKSITYFQEKGGKWGTPTTLVQAGYETVEYIEGYSSESDAIEKLDKLYETNFGE